MIKLYNSLTKRKEVFVPREKNKVKLYVCGITPYDTTHLGHAFTYIHFDILARYLRFSGYEVIYTQNVTDIDDDILKKALESGKNWQELGNYWTKQYLEDMKKLNVQLPTHFVKATNSIPTMTRIIEKLLNKQYAYKSGGNVYFDISKFEAYGKLSRLSKREMIALSKERGANPNDPNKKNPLDFILWQSSKPKEPVWDALFGKGRPGWHIECSAMNLDCLGEQIDIHGGGKDLIFPHHESEIAQSESFTGVSPFAKLWMHTAMVLYQGDKMSKSLGNIVMISDLLKTYSPNAIRFLLLSHHYRKPWEFDIAELNKAENDIEQIKKGLNNNAVSSASIKELSDDLNTPKALKMLIEHPSREDFKLLGFKV